MESPNKNDGQKAPYEYSGWGALLGTATGLVIGIVVGHWLIWAIFLGVLSWVVGALIDRSRR